MRHVEVLLLQPSVVMVVDITSTGGVAKKLVTFDDPGRPGPRFLGERVSERAAHRGRPRHAPASQADRRPQSLHAGARLPRRSAPVVPRACRPDAQSLYVGGAACAPRRRPCRRARGVPEPPVGAREARRRARADRGRLRRRAARSSGSAPSSTPGLHDVSLVGATYGLPTRTLGTVGLLGPVRMDYDKAIRTVRAAAHELSRLVESNVRDESGTSCPMATAERDYYELLGVERTATRRRSRRPSASSRASCTPTSRRSPTRRQRFREVAEAYEVLSKAETRQLYDRYGHAGLSAAASRRATSTSRQPHRHLLGLLRRRPLRRATGAAGRAAATSVSRSRSSSPMRSPA